MMIFIKVIKTHYKILLFLLALLFLTLIMYICGCFKNFSLVLFGALLSTLFVFIFVEVSMQMEKEAKWAKCKEYTFYVLNMHSAKLLNNFIQFENESITIETPIEERNKVFLEESAWRDKILNDITGKEISNYIDSIDNINWLKYSKKLINNCHTYQLEKIFDKLISIKIEEDIIDYLSKFLTAKARLNHLVGMGNYDLGKDGDGKRDAIEKMLFNCVHIYNLTKNKIEPWEEPEID